MYEELISDLRYCADKGESCGLCNHYEDGLLCLDNMLMQAADAIEELKRDLDFAIRAEAAATEACKPRWIPVTERLPEAGERVMCYCRANIYEAMKMRTDGDWVCDTNHVYMHSFVTHWMPLPQPPKEET